MGPGMKRLIRVSLATTAGGGAAAFLSSPLGLILAPVLSGVFKALRSGYTEKKETPPWWTKLF